MSTADARPVIAMLGAVPADVQTALTAEFRLLAPEDWIGLPPDRLANIDRGLTSAMGSRNWQ